MANASKYIDWQAARLHLQEIAAEVVDALRVCDIVQLGEEPESLSIDDLAVEEFIPPVVFTEEQVAELSKAYRKKASRVKASAVRLLSGEVIEECP